MDVLYGIYEWLDYYTSDHFFANLWLDIKYHTQNFLRPLPSQKEGEEFDKYLCRLPLDQALRVSKYHLQKWSDFIERVKTTETFFLPADKRFEISHYRRNAKGYRDTWKEYCEAFSIAIALEKEVNAGK